MLINLLLTGVIILFHLRYADMWFNDCGGVRWYWTTRDAPWHMKASRVFLAASLLGSMLRGIAETGNVLGWFSLVCLFAHVLLVFFTPEDGDHEG